MIVYVTICTAPFVGEGLMHYGVIATGNHSYLDSLRDAPPSLAVTQLSILFLSEMLPFRFIFTAQ